jgi:hypothetical protein
MWLSWQSKNMPDQQQQQAATFTIQGQLPEPSQGGGGSSSALTRGEHSNNPTPTQDPAAAQAAAAAAVAAAEHDKATPVKSSAAAVKHDTGTSVKIGWKQDEQNAAAAAAAAGVSQVQGNTSTLQDAAITSIAKPSASAPAASETDAPAAAAAAADVDIDDAALLSRAEQMLASLTDKGTLAPNSEDPAAAAAAAGSDAVAADVLLPAADAQELLAPSSSTDGVNGGSAASHASLPASTEPVVPAAAAAEAEPATAASSLQQLSPAAAADAELAGAVEPAAAADTAAMDAAADGATAAAVLDSSSDAPAAPVAPDTAAAAAAEAVEALYDATVVISPRISDPSLEEPLPEVFPAELLDSSRYALAPSCLFPPSATNSLSDAQGRLWGWMRGSSCLFRQLDSTTAEAAANATARAASKLAWETAVVCNGVPNGETSLMDEEGNLWGWQNSRSCSWRGIKPAVVRRGQLPIEMQPMLWEEATACLASPTVENTMPDSFGRFWGEEEGRTCAFKVGSCR